MAACGAKVLMLRCVEYARRYNVPLHVRSSFSGRDGTWVVDVSEEEQVEQAIISGVAHDRSEAKITVVGVPDKPGEAAAIFRALADAEINIDMIVQNVSSVATARTDISFTLPKTDGQAAVAALRKIKDEVGFEDVLYDDQIGKVSLIGAGMRSHPGVSASFFGALADAGGQRRDHLDVGDPDLGRVPRHRRRCRGARGAHGVRPRRRPISQRRCTAEPADERSARRRRRRDRAGRRRHAPHARRARVPGRGDAVLCLEAVGRSDAAVG